MQNVDNIEKWTRASLEENVRVTGDSPYPRIHHYWIDSEAAPANGGSGM